MENIKDIIVVSSGKGGVGKSTVSVNLSIALAKKKVKVGLLDADIYGPSIPKMLNINEKPNVNETKKIIPFEKYGIYSMSIGNLISPDKPVIWRGAMVVSALNQMINDIEWNKIDILIIDLPPGTGDIQLSLSQKLPLTGAVVVSTPQEVALIDVRRAINMFQRVNVKILGLIENMSFFETNGIKNYIFGKEGVSKESKIQKIAFLGEIPIFPDLAKSGDIGKPLTLTEGNNVEKIYSNIADKLLQEIQTIRKKSPKIEIE